MNQVLRGLIQYFFDFEILNLQIYKFVPFSFGILFLPFSLVFLLNFLRHLILRVGI